LNALDRKRHLLDDPLQKVEGFGARGAALDAEHLVATAIADRGVLIDAWPDLADVHLDPVSGDRAASGVSPCTTGAAASEPAHHGGQASDGWCRAPVSDCAAGSARCAVA
jgi:hypothetical protein